MTQIGAGIIILVCVWVAAVILCLLFTRAHGPLQFLGFAFILAAVIITLVLALLPIGPAPPEGSWTPYDTTFVPRVVVVTVLGFVMLVGFVVVACVHAFDQQHGRAVKWGAHNR